MFFDTTARKHYNCCHIYSPGAGHYADAVIHLNNSSLFASKGLKYRETQFLNTLRGPCRILNNMYDSSSATRRPE